MRTIRECGLDSREFVWGYATGLTPRRTREFFPRLYHRESGHHFTFRRDHVVLVPSDGVRRERAVTADWDEQKEHLVRWLRGFIEIGEAGSIEGDGGTGERRTRNAS